MNASHPIGNIALDLANRAHDHGDRWAFRIIDTPTSWPRAVSYHDLHSMVSSCAGALAAQGIGTGSRVVVFVPMSLDLYVVLLALFRIGAVAVFIDPWGGRQMIEAAAALVDADAFIGISKAHALRASSRTIRRIPVHVVTGTTRSARTAARLPRTTLLQQIMGSATPIEHSVEVDASDPALITFTGGTTGVPKGADRTHGFLAAQHKVLERNVELSADDLCLTNLPIVVLHGLGRGTTTILPPSAMAQDPRVDGAWLHDLLDELRVAVMAVSPAPVDGLARSRRRSPVNGVRHIYTGGGPVLPELIERVKPIVPQATFTAIFGSTEAEPITHAHGEDVILRRDELRARGGIWIGTPVPDIQTRVIRTTSGPVEIDRGTQLDDWTVRDGAPGELIVAGPHVNQKYFRNPEAERTTKIDDENGTIWHRTGDIVRADGEGGYWLLGRRGADIRLGGARMWPLEIETRLSDHPDIARAAVVTPQFDGVQREFRNASAVVAVEPGPGRPRGAARHAALEILAASGLDAFLEIRTLDRIPVDKRHATKIDTDALRGMLKPRDTGDY